MATAVPSRLRLASDLEGREVADWFSARGFTAFVLKYRLGVQRAIRLVRSLAVRCGIATDRVGIIGFRREATWRPRRRRSTTVRIRRQPTRWTRWAQGWTSSS